LLFVTGALAFAVAAPIIMFSFASLLALYDAAFPVAEARLAKVERIDPETIRLQLYVTRKRDCETLRVVGFTGLSRTDMQAATTMRREDGADPISYPVGVTVLSRPWLLSPVVGPHLWIYGYYECDSRIVKQRLIDEVLP
jgi:hypothetical protein